MLRDHLAAAGLDAAEPIPSRLVQNIDGSLAGAERIRDRFSPDGMAALKDLSKTARRLAGKVQAGDDATRAMTVLLRKLAGFSGLVHENMYRFTGWRFLEIGRRLERGIQTAWLVARLGRADAPDGALEALLEIGDSVITHRRRYSINAGRNAAIDLLVLDASNPRSVLFQLEAIGREIAGLPGQGQGGSLSPLGKAVLRARAALAVVEPKDVSPDILYNSAGDLANLYDRVAEAYFN
jgi:uncharacterized alpha-E superfamily protein